jgi:Putative MetA-pathway of phenol degradation
MMPRPMHIVYVATIALAAMVCTSSAAEKDPIDVISDNSFLVEEAYNQELNVVQHIFNAIYINDPSLHGWAFSFTQEWPVFSELHQFSFTIPGFHLNDTGQHQYGVGDILLNYRYQALQEDEKTPAFAPRFSVILPTGNDKHGTGSGSVGFQWQLPFSKKVTPRIALHFDAGLTYLPHARAVIDGPGAMLSPRRSLVSYNLGASAIYALLPRLHLMLEWVGSFDQSINDIGRAERAFTPIISPGIRTAVINEEKLQVVVGAGVPIGLKSTADNIGTFLYFSIEHALF